MTGKRLHSLWVIFVAAAVLTGCAAGGGDDGSVASEGRGGAATQQPSHSAEPVKCTNLTDKALASLRQGLRRSHRDIILRSGATVSLPESLDWPLGDGGQMWVAAVRITDGEHKEVDLFALSDPQANGGLVFALGDALTWFFFGEDAMPGSPVGDYLDEVEHSDEAKGVRGCV